jgi:hypothetical protein
MIPLDFPRDVAFMAAVFGVATFAWAGWAQERPPRTAWRIVLGALALAGIAVVGLTLPAAIRDWDTPTALVVDSAPFAVYVVMVAVELVAGGIAAAVLMRRGVPELVAPVIMIVVGIHWIPMIWVFQQPVLALIAAWCLLVGIAAFLLPRDRQAPSFWCGILGAPALLAVGVACAAAYAARP